MNINNLGREYSHVIFSCGEDYFIPCDSATAFSEEFNKLSKDGYIKNNFSIGTGWMFDQKGINEIKRIFEEQKVSYIECSLSKI